MKVNKMAPSAALFRPVTVEITFESQDELDSLNTMGNSLTPSEIASGYSYDSRTFVMVLLETLQDGVQSES